MGLSDEESAVSGVWRTLILSCDCHPPPSFLCQSHPVTDDRVSVASLGNGHGSALQEEGALSPCASECIRLLHTQQWLFPPYPHKPPLLQPTQSSLLPEILLPL